MNILKLKASGDYDRKYYINIATSNDFIFIEKVKNALNDFCSSLQDVDKEILMSRYFGDIMFEKQFNDFMLPIMDYHRAHALLDKIKEACDKNYVYLCSDNFVLEEVLALLK